MKWINFVKIPEDNQDIGFIFLSVNLKFRCRIRTGGGGKIYAGMDYAVWS